MSKRMPWPCRSLFLLAVCALPVAMPAQDAAKPKVETEADADRMAVQALTAFARAAEGNKVGSRAKETWEMILAVHDVNEATARGALGYRKEKGEWKQLPAEKLPKFDDTASPQQMQRVKDAWLITTKKLDELHRTFGQQLLEKGNLVRGQWHLERALFYAPGDVEAHKALGHVDYKGFYGTETQIAFLRRLDTVEAKVAEVKAMAVATEALPATAMPEELKRTGLDMMGAKSAHITLWVHGLQEDAVRMCEWGERAIAMLEFLLGERLGRQQSVGSGVRAYRWYAVMRSDEDHEVFFDKNPQVVDKMTDVKKKRFASYSFASGGGTAMIAWHRAAVDADWIIAHVTMEGFAGGCNDGLGQGLVHAMTTMLVGTTYTWFGALPPTEAGGSRGTPHDPTRWLERLREAARTGKDFQTVQVPRERLDSYRQEARWKAWGLVTWLVVRFPEQWANLLRGFPKKDILMPEDVEKVIEKELGLRLADLEMEWREWLFGESPFGRAAWHGGTAGK